MNNKKKKKAACPFCGQEIDANAKACPHCGSDELTGWSDQKYLDGIDLPDDFDYEKLRREEFGAKEQKKTNQKNRQPSIAWQVIIGILLLIAFLIGLLRGVL